MNSCEVNFQINLRPHSMHAMLNYAVGKSIAISLVLFMTSRIKQISLSSRKRNNLFGSKSVEKLRIWAFIYI